MWKSVHNWQIDLPRGESIVSPSFLYPNIFNSNWNILSMQWIRDIQERTTPKNSTNWKKKKSHRSNDHKILTLLNLNKKYIILFDLDAPFLRLYLIPRKLEEKCEGKKIERKSRIEEKGKENKK